MESPGASGPSGGGTHPEREVNTGTSPPAGSPPSWQETPNPAPPSGATNWTANLTSSQPVAGPAGYVYADLPNRIIAYIIDAIILVVIYVVVGIVLSAVLGPSGQFRPTADNPFNYDVNYGSALIGALVNTAISAAYFIYTWTAMRGTPGMKLLGMQVGNETDGASLSTNQALTRWVLLGGPLGLASALNPIPTIGLLIGFLALIWFIVLLVTTAQSPTKQGMHDRYAHSVVVKSARAVG